jgi:predicted Zn finger-like uncharacterized protein
MILTCPKCETQYFADDSTIGESGRTVKCNACTHAWHVPPPGAKSAAAATAPAHEVYRERVREQRRQKSRFAALASWLVTATAFFAIGLGSVLLRNDVVKAWPQSAALYKRIGFPVNRYGLEFADIERSRTFNDTVPVVTVSGRARNVARTTVQTPAIRVLLKDEKGKTVVTTYGTTDARTLAPGAAGRFEIIIAQAPMESYEIELSFVDRKSVPKMTAAPEPAPKPALPDLIAVDANAIAETPEPAPSAPPPRRARKPAEPSVTEAPAPAPTPSLESVAVPEPAPAEPAATESPAPQ